MYSRNPGSGLNSLSYTNVTRPSRVWCPRSAELGAHGASQAPDNGPGRTKTSHAATLATAASRQAQLVTVLVVVVDVLDGDLLKVMAVEDEEPVQAFPPGCEHEPLGERVGVRLQLHPVVKVRALS